MKKLILLLVTGIFLINLVYAAENCELALPRYGVVQCINLGQTETVPFNPIIFSCSDGSWCSIQLPCLSNCELIENRGPDWVSPIFWSSKCSDWTDSREWEIILNGNNLKEVSTTKWNRGDSLVVHVGCINTFTKSIDAPPAGTSIQYRQDKIMLKEGWAGSLPDTPISDSEGCILNSQIHEETNLNSYFDPSTGTTKSKESSSYPSLNDFPSNWKIGDHYIFVKDWQTGIADISVTTDKNNNQYWCGGQYGSRKIYQVQKIISSSGKCYVIPQGISSTVECCFPSDCVDKYGTQYTCNPDDWKCEKTKPCNSQLECDQVFGEGACQNKQVSKWTCDTSKKWGNYAGTCINSIRNVEQCPLDCTTDEYYNEQEGKCKPRVVLLDCPAGKCCIGGSNYKTKSCSGDLKCCASEGAVVGECRKNCGEIGLNNVTSNIITGNVVGVSGIKKSALIMVGIIGAIILGVVASFLFKKRKLSHLLAEGKIIEGIKCLSCGSINEEGKKFCTNCGEDIKEHKKKTIVELEKRIKEHEKELTKIKKERKKSKKS